MSANTTTAALPYDQHSLHSALSAFLPGMVLPPPSNLDLVVAHLLLILVQFTTTFQHPILPLLRLGLGLASGHVFWQYGFTRKYDALFQPRRARYNMMGMNLIGLNGIMKLIEICIIGFTNKAEDWPKWVSKKEKEEDGKRKIIPFTPSVTGRFLYAIDLLSVRGSSWFKGRVWDYSPIAIAEYRAPTRLQFLVRTLWSAAQQYIVLDIIETIMQRRSWDTRNPNPITTLPILQQPIYALCVCIVTCLSISASSTINSFQSILLGAPPSSWPPMFDDPFGARSLAEFWTFKWHAIFRRSFDRLSYGILLCLPLGQLRTSQRATKLIRAIIIFTLSMTVHLFLMWSLPLDENHPYASFFNLSALKFFLSQPLGLIIELECIFPLTRNLSETRKRGIRRAFAWAWLLWSGRFWSDVWVSRGMWDYEERFIVYSPLRKALYGTWTP